MTTGTIGSMAGFGYGPGGFYKTWSGGNQKHETVGGVLRTKWNNYTCTIKRQYDVKTSNGIFPGNYINVTGEPPWSTLFTANDELALLAKLSSAVKEHDFNLAVNVAQGRQTVDLVVGNLAKLGRSMLALKRGDFATAARQLGTSPRKSRLKPQDISGRWLELQYGWLPMLGDTFEACKAWEALSRPRSDNIVVTRSTSGKFNGSQSPSNWSGWGTWKFRVRIEYERQEQISTARSLGLLDPLSVVWEIIPYSFVVDWFLPIGTYLEVLNQIPNLSGRFLRTVSRFYNNEGIPTKQGESPPFYDYRGCHARYNAYYCDRQNLSSLPVPFPTFSPISKALSPKRFLNAYALTAQIFRL